MYTPKLLVFIKQRVYTVVCDCSQMSEEDELNLLSLVTANSANSSIMILSLCSHDDLITKVSDDCGHIT